MQKGRTIKCAHCHPGEYGSLPEGMVCNCICHNNPQKIALCKHGIPAGHHCMVCHPMLDTLQTMEERVLAAIIFDELTDYDESREPTRWKINQEKVLNLLKSEQSRLLKLVLEKKEAAFYVNGKPGDGIVLVEDILSIAQAEVIEL